MNLHLIPKSHEVGEKVENRSLIELFYIKCTALGFRSIMFTPVFRQYVSNKHRSAVSSAAISTISIVNVTTRILNGPGSGNPEINSELDI